MKFKISKSLWEETGKKMGWLDKQAMGLPVRPEDQAEMAKERVYAWLKANPALPNMTKTEIGKLVQELAGGDAASFFGQMDAKAALELPFIYHLKSDEIVQINGKNYLIVDIEEPRLVKKVSTINGTTYQKGDNYPGEVTVLSADTGNLEVIRIPDIQGGLEGIKSSPEAREQVMVDMNTEILRYNQKIEAINKAAGPTRISLQVKSSEQDVLDRISTLNAQEAALKKMQENPLSVSPAYGKWIQFLKDGIKSGSFSVRDTFDTLLFLYQSNPQELINKIQSNEIQVPDEIKAGLLAIAQQETSKKKEQSEFQAREEVEQEQRMQEVLPEEKEPEEKPLGYVKVEDIPEQKYKKPFKYKTLHHWTASLGRAISSIQKDRTQLQQLADSFKGLRVYMGALQKGQRADEYLNSPEGQSIIEDLRRFLDASQSFIKRYKTDIVQDGKINPALFGRAGTLGNAFIAVSLSKIYNVLQKTIGKYVAPVEQVAVPAEAPTPSPAPVTSSEKDRIQKMSDILWDKFQEKWTPKP